MPFLNKSTLTYPATNSFPNGIWLDNRNPTSADYKSFQIGVIWINSASSTAWIMVDKTATNGTWIQMSATGTGILTITGDTGGAVGADGSNNINLFSADNLTISGDALTNTLTINLDAAIASLYTADSGSAIPSSGNLNILGTGGLSTSGSGSTITVTAGNTIPTQFTTDSGSAIPALHNLNIIGGTGCDTTASGSTVTINTHSSVPLTFTTDSGIAIPSANNLDIVGGGGIDTSGLGDTVTITNTRYTVAEWIVNPLAGEGTSATIASAIASASSGDTIFVWPGTYTENLTLKAGVNITTFNGESGGHVTIIGKLSYSGSGSVELTNLYLQTNGDFILQVTGANASIVNLNNCYLNCINATGISFSSSNSSSFITLDNCTGNLGTTGIAVFNSSSAGSISFLTSTFNNSATSTTANTISTGALTIIGTNFFNPLTTSGTSVTNISHSFFSASNTTCFTYGSTVGGAIIYSTLVSGTASALSVGAGSLLEVRDIIALCSNANVTAGAGTLLYTAIAGSTGALGTTNLTGAQHFVGISRSPTQPAFLAYLASTVNNATGNGTAFTLGTTTPLTEVFDQNSNFNPTTGVFTAPITGRYQFEASAFVSDVGGGHTQGFLDIVTTAATYRVDQFNPANCRDSGNSVQFSGSCFANMTAGDTAFVNITISNSTLTVSIQGSATRQTYFSGNLVC